MYTRKIMNLKNSATRNSYAFLYTEYLSLTFVLFGVVTSGSAQGLLLVLYSELTPSRSGGPSVLPGMQPHQLHVQQKSAFPIVLSLVPLH